MLMAWLRGAEPTMGKVSRAAQGELGLSSDHIGFFEVVWLELHVLLLNGARGFLTEKLCF